MISKPANWRQRLLYLTAYFVIASLISIPMINDEVHYIVVALLVMLPGMGIAMWISGRSGIIYLYLLTAFTAVLLMPGFYNHVGLSTKEIVSVNVPKEVADTDGAAYQFADAHVEKEKYGYYQYAYRGYTGYFAAPVVETGWTPNDPVYVWAVMDARGTPYDSLVFNNDSEIPMVVDSSTAIIETDTSAVSLDYPDVDPSTEYFIFYTGWNEAHKKGAIVKEDVLRYRDAVKNAEIKHGLVSAKDALLIHWTDAPEALLNDQKETSIAVFILMLSVLIIWFIVMEIKIAREAKMKVEKDQK
jgi:hypothetical protein